MKFKYSKLIIVLLTLLFIFVPGGLAIWTFTNNITHTIEKEIQADNIKENYVFGRDDRTNKIYTIYLFPSSVYAKIYQNYLEGSSSVLPEEAFGSYVFNGMDDGTEPNITLNYDNVKGIKENGKQYNTYYHYANHLNSYLTPSGNKRNIYDQYETVEYNEKYGTGNITTNGIGFPFRKGTRKENYIIGQYQYEFQYELDRYGGWKDLDAYSMNAAKNEILIPSNTLNSDIGRYLPMKLKVRNSITIDDFNNRSSTPICSMGDGNGWYDISFSSWVVFKKKQLVVKR